MLDIKRNQNIENTIIRKAKGEIMGNIKRQMSREDSYKSEHELVEMSPQQSKPATYRQSSTDKQDFTIEMKQLLKTHKIVKRRRCCGKTCRRISLIFYHTVIGLAVTVLGLWAIWSEFLKPNELAETPNAYKQQLNEGLNVAGHSKLTGEMVTETVQPEEYEIDTEQLFYKKEVHWKSRPGNDHVLSDTSNNTGCIQIKTSGKMKVFNSISFRLKDQERFYHSIALCREGRCDVVRLATFSWSQPQTGRQPSILQFLVEVETGDKLCLQTTDSSFIYAGHYDNSFLLEKVGPVTHTVEKNV